MVRAAARSHPLVRAAGLACALIGCAQNPAYEGSGGLSGASTGSDPDTGGSGPAPPCPGDLDYTEWYPDLDADTHGDRKAEPALACEAPPMHVADDRDCNDQVPEIHPMALERCNGLDDNCNQLVDESSIDCGACTVELTNSHVYWFCPEKQDITWAEAADRCNARSFKNVVRLASIHSAAEQQLVLEHVQNIDPVDGERHIWIGLVKQDAVADSCDPPDPIADWRWIDGTPFDLVPPLWSPGEPNNELCDPGTYLENCGELKIDAQTAGWNDVSCDAPARGFVCKTKRDPVLFPD
jgi:hypothetical protein